MKPKLTLLAALLSCAACSTWTPPKSVTLHDIDPALAHEEGADLRYQLSEPVECQGRGCRDMTTSAETLVTYHWRALCDGQFCDAAELEYVALVREAAEVGFTTEQVVAARSILATRTCSLAERKRLESFVEERLARLSDRIHATEDGLTRIPGDDDFAALLARDDVREELLAAWSNLERSRELLQMPRRSQPGPLRLTKGD